MTIVIAFDIGIRNLAWCCYNKDNKTILGWENYDLMYDSSVSSVKSNFTCLVCSKNGLYTHNSNYYCAKHTIKPIFKDLSGNVYKKMPNLGICKTILNEKKGTKEELYTQIKNNYSILIEKKKATKKAFDLEALHDSIRLFVNKNLELFRKAKIIGLENQPVLKNPTMKTVQILLYATLRDLLQPSPKMMLIHAGKKVTGTTVGEKGYADRKQGSVDRVNAFFKEHKDQISMKTLFDTSKKQNDLADSFCMCVDI